jgi:hypothetical protein
MANQATLSKHLGEVSNCFSRLALLILFECGKTAQSPLTKHLQTTINIKVDKKWILSKLI